MSTLQQLTAADRGVLRFITAGSVDDGKSTLIGRLLYDSKGVFADQLQAIGRSRHHRAGDEEFDLSLLTDGLEAEREQGITIDVAYRYFATPTRKFIVADAPGHEQYTRNMVTGASTAHAVIILVDATRASDGELLVQTRRHSALAHLLGIKHIAVAVNKLDLLDWDQAVFERIRDAYAVLAAKLGIAGFEAIPMSALKGDNVVRASQQMPWYQGPTLLQWLEGIEVQENDPAQPLRFPVQWVARHNGSQADDFRGYAGKVASGTVRRGDRIVVQPAGTPATVARVLTFEGDVEHATAGVAVTLVLAEDVDVSRGDVLVHADDADVAVSREFQADVCWLDSQPLNTARKYLIKQGTRTSATRIKAVHTRRDVQVLEEREADTSTLAMNDIGRITLATRDALVLDAYDRLPATGAFILVDEATYQTVAGGMIRR